jgi:hypothetical protein
MKISIFLAGAVAGLCVLSMGARARATPNFPGAVQRILGASSAPQCSICHVCGITGLGTVNTPWGIAVRSRGLQAFNEASLATALAAMERDRVDSDGDGVIDVDAVRMGKDPNPSGTCDTEDDTIPTYGCVGRIAPGGSGHGAISALTAMIALLVARAARRVSRTKRLGWLILLLIAGALASCASGASLSPRPDSAYPPAEPRMQPLAPSTMAGDLLALGLDPMRLPLFEDLSPKQRRRLMSTFSRSLGFACTTCHQRDDYRLPTREKSIAVRMWNEFTRPYSAGENPVFCDSCHRGQGMYLDRRDKKAVSRYMTENFTDKLVRGDGKDVECSTCHGDPFEPKILASAVRDAALLTSP